MKHEHAKICAYEELVREMKHSSIHTLGYVTFWRIGERHQRMPQTSSLNAQWKVQPSIQYNSCLDAMYTQLHPSPIFNSVLLRVPFIPWMPPKTMSPTVWPDCHRGHAASKHNVRNHFLFSYFELVQTDYFQISSLYLALEPFCTILTIPLFANNLFLVYPFLTNQRHEISYANDAERRHEYSSMSTLQWVLFNEYSSMNTRHEYSSWVLTDLCVFRGRLQLITHCLRV